MNETVPTFEDMRIRLHPVWEKDCNKEMIVWAGIFGSAGRGRARKKSDVDIVLLMKEGDIGEPLHLDRGQSTLFDLRHSQCMYVWSSTCHDI